MNTSRFFSVVTYNPDTAELAKILESKSSSIRSWAMIKHDKDKTDVHHHIVVRTFINRAPLDVAKWFQGEQNAFAQIVFDRKGIIDYLTHQNETDEKAKYTPADIIDHGLDDLIPKGEKDDDCAQILEKMLANVSLVDIVKVHGKDFVYHYNHFARLANRIIGLEKF